MKVSGTGMLNFLPILLSDHHGKEAKTVLMHLRCVSGCASRCASLASWSQDHQLRAEAMLTSHCNYKEFLELINSLKN